MNPEKSHNTGIRLLEVLKILLNENISKNDILEKFKLNYDIENVYSSEIFLRYFNTLELLGFNIKKSGAKYSLKNALFKIDLTLEEKKILSKFISYIAKYGSKKSEKTLENIAFKLNKYTDIDITDILNNAVLKQKIKEDENKKNNLLKTIKTMLNDEQNVSITYQKNKNTAETISAVLKYITEKSGKVMVICHDISTGRNKNIKLNSIISVKQQPQKIAGIQSKNSVIFNVYDELALTYKLKPSEKVIDFGENFMTISNTDEDQETLFLRILKYGENCKIVSPVYVKDEFAELVDAMLKNLEN